MNGISFNYDDLTRHVEITIGAFMESASQSTNKREREAYKNKAEGVLMAWATLVWKPVRAQGESAKEAHREDYARFLDIVGESERAAHSASRRCAARLTTYPGKAMTKLHNSTAAKESHAREQERMTRLLASVDVNRGYTEDQRRQAASRLHTLS
jgi:hypothetical protein